MSDNKLTINHDRLSVRKAIESKDSYLVYPVFPCGALHMIVGESGMGKTSWSLPMLHDWEQGISVLGGLPSHPCKWVYISLDRSLQDLNRTLKRLGLGDWNIPAYSIEELLKRETESGLLTAPTLEYLVSLFPDVKFFFIEGLQPLIPNTGRGQSQNKAEALWLIQMRDIALSRGITIIATEHKPKNSDTKSKRNAGLGSASLPGGVGTVVSFDYPESVKNGKNFIDTGERIVHLSGHNFAPYSLEYSKDSDGRLVLQCAVSGAERISYDSEDDRVVKLDTQLSVHPVEQVITTSVIHMWGGIFGLTESQVSRWQKNQVQSGRLEMVVKGQYRKVRVQ